MLERFTDEACNAVYLAIGEARRVGHDRAGVEHLLLGLLTEGSDAAPVLRSLGVTVESVRARLDETDPSAARSPEEFFPLPFTKRALSVLEIAAREAASYGSRLVGTEHIVLGIIRDAIPPPWSGLRTVRARDDGALAVYAPETPSRRLR